MACRVIQIQIIMRAFLLFSILAVLALSSCGSPKTSTQFYKAHKKGEGVTNFRLPGWVVWLGAGLAYNSVRDEDAKAALRLARKVGRLQLLAADEAGAIPAEAVNDFLRNSKVQGYEELLSVKSGKTVVNISARGRRDRIRNLLLLVNDEDGFVFLHLKSRVRTKDINQLIEQLMQLREKPEEEQEAEPELPRV